MTNYYQVDGIVFFLDLSSKTLYMLWQNETEFICDEIDIKMGLQKLLDESNNFFGFTHDTLSLILVWKIKIIIEEMALYYKHTNISMDIFPFVIAT